MDPREQLRMAAILAGSDHHAAPVPRPGRNREFDLHVQQTFPDVDPDQTDMNEIRRAAWRTWRTVPPSGPSSSSNRPSQQEEDDELARALALSAEEHRAKHGSKHHANAGSSRNTPIVIDDDDEQLQRAIAMSTETMAIRNRSGISDDERDLMEQAIAASLESGSSKGKRVQRDASPEDDLDAAIKASLASFNDERERKRQKIRPGSSSDVSPQPEVRPSPRHVQTTASSKTVDQKESLSGIRGLTPDAATEAVSQPVGLFLGGQKIDRAQLERDRLARQAARMGKTDGSGTQDLTSSNISRQTESASSKDRSTSKPSQPLSLSSASLSSKLKNIRRSLPPPLPRMEDHPLQSTGPFPRDAAGEYYLDGELRHVNLRIGKSSAADTFSPKDVFGDHSQMTLLITSSFVWDNPWIDADAVLPTPDVVPTIRICRPPTNDLNELRQKQGKLQLMGNGEVHSYPAMDGRRGSEHMKFSWIFYKTGRLRVAIYTANMVDYDWDRIENTVFIQDFLPAESSSKLNSSELPDFPAQFRTLFNHLKIGKALKSLIERHPFGKDIPLEAEPTFAAFGRYDWSRVQVRIVMSLSGKYTGFDKIQEFGLGRLGTIIREEGWVPQKGEKLAAEYQGSSLGSFSSKWLNDFYHCCQGKDLPTMSRLKDDKKMPPIKIIFPTLVTVDSSVNGRPGGGTMFCGNGYKPETAPLFHDANSKRGGVLMHTKMIIALFQPQPQTLGLQGSSGKRKTEDGTAAGKDVGGWVYVGSHNFSAAAWGTLNFNNKPPTLNISNYELGIVFPLPRSKANAMANKVAPHQRPPRPYTRDDVPWSQNQYMQ